MDKKNRVRGGLFFGIWMAIFNIGWSLATENNHTTQQVVITIVVGLIVGAISGLLFGWLTGLLAKSKFVQTTSSFEPELGENILFVTPANHFKGIEAIGGKLYLTEKRLVFKSHKLNIQNHVLSIILQDIISVDRYKTLGLVNNGLIISTCQNITEKFVVERAEEWNNKLNIGTSKEFTAAT